MLFSLRVSVANRSPGAAEISQSCVGSNWVVAGFLNDQVARGCPDVLLAEQLEFQLIGILLAYHVWALSLPKEWLLLLTLQVFPQADMWRRMLYQRAHLVESEAATHLLLDLVNDALSRSWQVHLVPERLQRPAQKTLVAVPVRLYSIVSNYLSTRSLGLCKSVSVSVSGFRGCVSPAEARPNNERFCSSSFEGRTSSRSGRSPRMLRDTRL